MHGSSVSDNANPFSEKYFHQGTQIAFRLVSKIGQSLPEYIPKLYHEVENSIADQLAHHLWPSSDDFHVSMRQLVIEVQIFSSVDLHYHIFEASTHSN